MGHLPAKRGYPSNRMALISLEPLKSACARNDWGLPLSCVFHIAELPCYAPLPRKRRTRRPSSVEKPQVAPGTGKIGGGHGSLRWWSVTAIRGKAGYIFLAPTTAAVVMFIISSPSPNPTSTPRNKIKKKKTNLRTTAKKPPKPTNTLNGNFTEQKTLQM